MLKRFAAAVGVLAALLVASPAYATDVVCPDWTLHSITGAEWESVADGSEIVDDSTVKLVKPDGGGTEFYAANGLGLSGTVTVDYQLDADADYSAGAIRLFVYSTESANTLTDVPSAFVAATADSGTLTLEDVETIGSLGLVYDASNTAGGVVTFSDLKVDGEPVSFTACPPPASPSATPPATTNPPTTGEPTAPAAADEETLPVTGAGTAVLFGIGGAVLLAGIGAVVLFRSRRRFEA